MRANKESRDGEHIYLIWDSASITNPEYVRGHVSMEVAQAAIHADILGAGVTIGSVAHVYMRMVFGGDGCPDGCTHEAREYAEPGPGAFKVTRCNRVPATPTRAAVVDAKVVRGAAIKYVSGHVSMEIAQKKLSFELGREVELARIAHVYMRKVFNKAREYAEPGCGASKATRCELQLTPPKPTEAIT